MNKKYGIAIAIIVVLAALGGGLYYFHRETEQKKEAEAFRGAAESTNALVLRNYIFSYPEAPQAHRDSILARLQLLDQEEDVWAEAIVSRTRAKLQAYMTATQTASTGPKCCSVSTPSTGSPPSPPTARKHTPTTSASMPMANT